MAIHYATRGFVIKKSDRGEADQVFTVFSKDFGKIEIVGKGIRRIKSKLRPNIDIFSLCQTEFIQGRAHKTLTDDKTIEGFSEIKKNLEKAKIALRISDSLDNFIIGQEKDLKIWELLREVFAELNDCRFKDESEEKKGLEALYRYFSLNFLSILGYR
jgi:DNA repair protein RecO (recombination protein O)